MSEQAPIAVDTRAQAECVRSNISNAPLSRGRTTPTERARLVLQAMGAGSAIPDAELRQHAVDCAWLMERAYARFQDHGDESGREEALSWDLRRKDALKALSPEWRAAREAQIQADIAAGGHVQYRAHLASQNNPLGFESETQR